MTGEGVFEALEEGVAPRGVGGIGEERGAGEETVLGACGGEAAHEARDEEASGEGGGVEIGAAERCQDGVGGRGAVGFDGEPEEERDERVGDVVVAGGGGGDEREGLGGGETSSGGGDLAAEFGGGIGAGEVEGGGEDGWGERAGVGGETECPCADHGGWVLESGEGEVFGGCEPVECPECFEGRMCVRVGEERSEGGDDGEVLLFGEETDGGVAVPEVSVGECGDEDGG